MKVTIYDLLGLIKDRDRKTPKKIKYMNRIYELDIYEEDYKYFMLDHYEYLLDNINTFSQLNDEVKIIEEDKEIEFLGKQDLYVDDAKGHSINIEKIGDKVNEIIEEVNKLKENINV